MPLPTSVQAALLEEHAGPLLVADAQGVLQFANASACRMLGWEPDALVGKPIQAVVPAAMRAKHQQGFRRYRETGVAKVLGRPIRVPVLCRNGSELRLEMTLAEVPGPDGPLFSATFREPGGARENGGTGEQAHPGRGPLEALESARAFLQNAATLEELAKRGIQAAQAHLGATVARLWLRDGEEWLRQPARVRRRGEALDPLPADVAWASDPSLVAVVARSGEAFVRNGLQEDSRWESDWLHQHRIQGVAILPLKQGGELLGVLAYFSDAPISQELAVVLGLFAALLEGQLQGAFRRRAEADRALLSTELITLADLTERVGQGEPPDTLLPALLEAARKLTGMDAGLVAVRDPGSEVVRVEWCVGHPSPVAGYVIPPGAGAVSEALSAGQVLSVPEYRAYGSPLPPLRQRGVQAVTVLPLDQGGEMLGALKLESKSAGRELTPHQRRLAGAIARLMALALGTEAAAGQRKV